MRSRWVSRLVMCTTARENFLNTSIVAASSAPSLSSGRCATGRGSSDTDGCCGRRVWMTVNTSAPATISSSTASTLVMPDSPRYCGGYGSRLTGYSDCDMSPGRVYRRERGGIPAVVLVLVLVLVLGPETPGRSAT